MLIEVSATTFVVGCVAQACIMSAIAGGRERSHILDKELAAARLWIAAYKRLAPSNKIYSGCLRLLDDWEDRNQTCSASAADVYQQHSTRHDSAMIRLIQRQSLTTAVIKRAASVCCSARPHAEAFAHAAAPAASRPRKSAASQSKLQQDTLSTGLSVPTVAALAGLLSSLPAEHNQHSNALDHIKQSLHLVYDLAAGPLCLAGPLRQNPTKRGHLGYGSSMKILWYAWKKLQDELYEPAHCELEHLMPSHDPR
jgi:hypothetical protein